MSFLCYKPYKLQLADFQKLLICISLIFLLTYSPLMKNIGICCHINSTFSGTKLAFREGFLKIIDNKCQNLLQSEV